MIQALLFLFLFVKQKFNSGKKNLIFDYGDEKYWRVDTRVQLMSAYCIRIGDHRPINNEK